MWGGREVWVRGQGEGLAKHIWYMNRWSGSSVVSIDWTGITEAEKEGNRTWCEIFKKEGELEDLKPSHRVDPWKVCRAGCGEENSTMHQQTLFFRHREQTNLIEYKQNR
jgi:hypothetical protein